MNKLTTLILLFLSYVAATWLPQPGVWLRELPLGSDWVHTPQLLLAIMLFAAGLCSSKRATESMWASRRQIAVMVAAGWAVPLICAAIAAVVLWGLLSSPPEVALGIIIIAAMPVANSSVGWSARLGGSVTLSIALLISATAISPLAAPAVIEFGAQWVGSAEETLRETPWNNGMTWFFVFWVLLPVLGGMTLAEVLPHDKHEAVVPLVKQTSFVVLILLNYLNGSACLPALADQPSLLVWPVTGAAALLFLTQAFFLLRLEVGDNSPERRSLFLAVTMRNTGAALVYAGAALPQFPLVSITIIAYTLLQHLWVGFVLAPSPSFGDNSAAALAQADS